MRYPRFCLALLLALAASCAQAERIKDLADVAGVRSNPLVGYGLIVGLDGTGDQTTQTPFTVQSIINMLSNMGVALPAGTSLQLKNVAAVMVTASLPAFVGPGQTLDVTVSSLGNAKSLRGGTLLMTPLKGADGNIYALAQGNLVVSGAGASGPGGKATINHLSAGRIPAGATVERAIPMSVGQGEFATLELHDSDFETAGRMSAAVNQVFGPGAAEAIDGRRVRVRIPASSQDRVVFMGRLESLELTPSSGAAKVIINSRTGSVVMNRAVQLQECAIAHGNLSVTVNNDQSVSQPAPLSAGTTTTTTNSLINIKQDGGKLIRVKPGSNLADVVKALNAVGANPMDMIAILQAMKASGALRAELEII